MYSVIIPSEEQFKTTVASDAFVQTSGAYDEKFQQYIAKPN
jgi:hypothetical protein